MGATGCNDRAARIFDGSTGLQELRIPHLDSVWSVAWRPCGLALASGCADRLARIYSLSGGIPEPDVRLHHKGEVRSVAWRLDGDKLATGCLDNLARVFDADTGKELVKMRHSNPVACVSWEPGLARGAD